MKMPTLAIAVSLIVSSAAHAYVADNHEYDLKCTADGYELTSKYPVSRIVGSGVGSRSISKREKLYLGRSCDAYTKTFGYGQWCWANGGFTATFPNHEYGFGRQELFCQPERAYQQNCRC